MKRFPAAAGLVCAVVASLVALSIVAGIGANAVDATTAKYKPPVLPKMSAARRRKVDKLAESNARELVAQVDACFGDTHTYLQCHTVAQLPGAAELHPVDGAPKRNSGKVGVKSAAANSFTIESASKSGVLFDVAAASGTTTRTCSPAGVGLCSTSGVWG
jgi:hypothetical protein